VVIYPRYNISPPTYLDRVIHFLVTFSYLIRLRTQGDMISKLLNNIVASKKDQSVINGFIMELYDDKILDSSFFVFNFELY
jgi:hypothetical protein